MLISPRILSPRLAPQDRARLGYVHVDAATEAACVDEKLGHVTLRSMPADDFPHHVRMLRTQTELLKATAVTSVSQALEKWMVLDMTDAVSQMKVSVFGELSLPLREVGKMAVSFMQVISSFVISFPIGVIDWPDAFHSIATVFANLNFDFFQPEVFSNLVGGLDYANTTIAYMLVAGVLFASLALSYRVAYRHHRPRLADRIVYLAVLIAFLLYPADDPR